MGDRTINVKIVAKGFTLESPGSEGDWILQIWDGRAHHMMRFPTFDDATKYIMENLI